MEKNKLACLKNKNNKQLLLRSQSHFNFDSLCLFLWRHLLAISDRLFNETSGLLLRIESFSARQRSHLPEPHLYFEERACISHFIEKMALWSLRSQTYWESLVLFLCAALLKLCVWFAKGGFRATNVLLNCIITGLDCGFVDDSFLLTLSIEGTIALVSTVAHLWCGVVVWLQDGFVVAWDHWFHVCWTAVAEFYCVPVEYFTESVTLWEVLFDQG